MADKPLDAIQTVTGVHRWLYISLGIFFVGLAIVGSVLPILPTTPFLIIASGLFMRSSPSLRSSLLRIPVWGPALRQWDEHRAISPRVKWAVVMMIPSVVAITVILGQFSWPVIGLLFGLAGCGLIVVWRLPVIEVNHT